MCMRILALCPTVWDEVLSVAVSPVQSVSVTHWPWVAVSGLFSGCWLDVPGFVNIDKCALKERLPLRSSPMPQTNEFLKTASIKLQARSIGHRVDFISGAQRGVGANTSLPPGYLVKPLYSPELHVGFCLNCDKQRLEKRRSVWSQRLMIGDCVYTVSKAHSPHRCG